MWDGEAYVETHRGTYTTQSEIKHANRLCELQLREAEIWSALAYCNHETVRPCSRQGQKNWLAPPARLVTSVRNLRPWWEKLLLYQFHDILPGSSIGMVYAEALPVLAEVEAAARALAESSKSCSTVWKGAAAPQCS